MAAAVLVSMVTFLALRAGTTPHTKAFKAPTLIAMQTTAPFSEDLAEMTPAAGPRWGHSPEFPTGRSAGKTRADKSRDLNTI